jgi:hypothetical protein
MSVPLSGAAAHATARGHVSWREVAISPGPGRRILSIASAPGWGALFTQEEKEDEYAFAEDRLVTLAAWALVEEAGGQTLLVGLVQQPATDEFPAGTFSFADEVGGFAGYSNQGLKTKPADYSS